MITIRHETVCFEGGSQCRRRLVREVIVVRVERCR
jgi:hypothetical protein